MVFSMIKNRLLGLLQVAVVIVIIFIIVLTCFWLYPVLPDFGESHPQSYFKLIKTYPSSNSSILTSSPSPSSPPSPPSPQHQSVNSIIKPTLISPPKDKWYWIWSEPSTYLWTQAAYIDTRTAVYNTSVVISLAHREVRPGKINLQFKWYCHLKTKSNPDICTGVTKLDRDVEGIGYQFHSFSTGTYFICTIPTSLRLDDLVGVAFSSKKCDSSKITPFVPITQIDKNVKYNLGLCIHKALFDVNDVQPLVEYIELHRLLGVQFFTIYIQKVSQNVREILEEYSREGLVDLVDWKITISPKLIRDFGQVGVIHECLLRNQYRVKYLGFSDFDEIFVPLKVPLILELLKQVDSPEYGSFRFLHVFMHKSTNSQPNPSSLQCPNVRYPSYFQSYKHSNFEDSYAYSGNTLGSKAKIIVKPKAIVRMGRHSMHLRHLHKFAPNFKEFTIPGEQGLLFHFRNKLQRGLEKRPLVDDKILSKYENQLIEKLNSRICHKK